MNLTLIKYDSLDSTNAEAARLYQSGKASDGKVIVAAVQTKGKGYKTNSWESEPGKNLTFSILLKPEFIIPSDQFVITQLVSLSLWEVLNSILRNREVSIKWPNDLYVDHKKIAGILIQNFIVGDSIDMSIIGIGVNVSQKVFKSDAPNPTSIILESGIDCPLDNLLEDILDTFNQRIESFKLNCNHKSITREYLSKLYRYGIKASYKDANGTFNATITGISKYGQLLLTDENGSERSYGFKEVEYLHK